MTNFPLNTATAVKLNKLIRIREKINTADIPSTRMIKCASVLPDNEFVGWQMRIPQKGLVSMEFFGSNSISTSDLEWIGENCAKMSSIKVESTENDSSCLYLYQLSLNVADKSSKRSIGFGASEFPNTCSANYQWPTSFSTQFGEIVKCLRECGATIRFMFCRPNNQESEQCRHHFLQTWKTCSIDSDLYLGKPIKVSVLILLPSEPTIRIKSILDEAVSGITFTYLGNINDKSTTEIWTKPMLAAKILPEYAARIIMLEPLMLSENNVIGIEVCEKEIPPLPASHENPKGTTAITLGTSLFTSGEIKKIKIDDTGLKMHWDLVGMSGTGKSSLLIQTVLSAIATNHSCTVLDPHGCLIDSIIRCVPEKYTKRLKVIRMGSADINPIPIRLHKTNDIEKEEIAINNICSMFQEIFDPHNQGYVGPRWIRTYSLLSKASLALGLGGTFQSILAIAQSKDNLKKVLDALGRDHNEKHRDIYEGIRSELLGNNSNDYQEIMSWFVSKFQRLTAISQLRNVFGTAGSSDALNFTEIIDTDSIVLIDLASPVIGTDAARVTGTLLINQLWDAVLTRKDRNKTHICVVDEAHLFSGSGSRLGRLIYEGRKFGISLIMAHQNYSQLSSDIKDALTSTANFSSFRLSVRDALDAAARFDNESFKSKLCRLNNFRAVTTLSVNGKQTDPFTLIIKKPRQQKDCERIALEIEQKSLTELVEPYRNIKALSTQEIITHIENFGYNNEQQHFDEIANQELLFEPEDYEVDFFFPDEDDAVKGKDKQFLDAWKATKAAA